MDEPQIRPVGVSYGGQPTQDSAAEATRLKISRAANLSDLCEEYEFYSSALLYLGVPLGKINPYADFLATVNEDIQRISIRFGKPVFKGMDAPSGDKEWNHVLYGMPKQHWERFLRYMGSLGFTDRAKGRVTRLRTQEIEIADPLYFDKAVILPDKCPTVKITVFVLDTNHGCWYLQTGAHPLLDLPRVVWDKSTLEDTEIFANVILHNEHDPSPYQAIEQAKSEQAGRSIAEIELEERVRRERESKDKDAD